MLNILNWPGKINELRKNFNVQTHNGRKKKCRLTRRIFTKDSNNSRPQTGRSYLVFMLVLGPSDPSCHCDCVRPLLRPPLFSGPRTPTPGSFDVLLRKQRNPNGAKRSQPFLKTSKHSLFDLKGKRAFEQGSKQKYKSGSILSYYAW